MAGRLDGKVAVVTGGCSGIGLAIGCVLGLLASFLITRIDDHLIETAITFVLAYGAFIVAETFHVSGVLAVVAAGLINGNIGPRGMSSTTRLVVFNFWEFMSFLVNSFVFLLIGLVVDWPLLVRNWQAILWGILAALLSRLIVVYGLFPRAKTIPHKWKHILYWGGLRGAISLALVLGLPGTLGLDASGQIIAWDYENIELQRGEGAVGTPGNNIPGYLAGFPTTQIVPSTTPPANPATAAGQQNPSGGPMGTTGVTPESGAAARTTTPPTVQSPPDTSSSSRTTMAASGDTPAMRRARADRN